MNAWAHFVSVLTMLACATSFDLCIVGDSTLQMFASAWAACEKLPSEPCSFQTIDSGTYYEQHYEGRIYNRQTTIMRALHNNCSVLFAEFQDLAWLFVLRKFWADRGRDVVCRRTITNYHHHAHSFLKERRTAASVANMMSSVEVSVKESLGSMNAVAWLLPTMPTDNDPAYAQTIHSVTETSILMSASGAETIATIQLLSLRLQRMGDVFADRMHVWNHKMLQDAFTVSAMRSFLASEFKKSCPQ